LSVSVRKNEKINPIKDTEDIKNNADIYLT